MSMCTITMSCPYGGRSEPYSESLVLSSPDSCVSNQPISCFKIERKSSVRMR